MRNLAFLLAHPLFVCFNLLTACRKNHTGRGKINTPRNDLVTDSTWKITLESVQSLPPVMISLQRIRKKSLHEVWNHYGGCREKKKLKKSVCIMNLRYEMYEFITENTISYIHLSKHYGRNEIVCISYEFDCYRNKKIHYRGCEFMPK